MNIIRRLAIGAAATVVASASHSATAAAPESGTPSVVIVHGAFADGSDFAKVVPLLQAKGVDVVVVQNPLTSLGDDVAATKRAIDSRSGKVVLVGHSWGGAVITEAGEHAKVAALVYIAAFAPEAGQSVGESTKGFPRGSGNAHMVADTYGFLSLTPEGISQHFAQDLPAATTAVMGATQGPLQGKSFGQKLSMAAWTQKPSWYLVTENDRMIVPELQRALAKKIGARTSSVSSSHVPQQSQPAAVAAVILDAVQASK